ncbi:MAG: prolipoprotein diacylglyceryl transferase, partial [Coriobacteriia bacterium]|nr:prolipoprotein diacylglyceryl transferase [Coriobacteriia bacterium]
MSPILARLTIGDAEYVLRAYSTFYTLAWVVAPVVGALFAHRRGLPWRRVLAIYALALAAGIAGARALDLFVAWRYYATDPARVWGAFAGYSLYGGLLIATGVGIALARAWRVSIWRAADAAVPALVVGQVLMRTGCFLNGCCYGLPTDLPWGVVYPAGSPVWQAQLTSGTQGLLSGFAGVVNPVHPTQLYEMLGAVLFGLIALRMMQRGHDADVADATAR